MRTRWYIDAWNAATFTGNSIKTEAAKEKKQRKTHVKTNLNNILVCISHSNLNMCERTDSALISDTTTIN